LLYQPLFIIILLEPIRTFIRTKVTTLFTIIPTQRNKFGKHYPLMTYLPQISKVIS
jgi:hypothetical protein